MALPSFTYSGVSYSGKPAGTTAFALTTSGGKAIPYLQRAHIHVASTTDGGATMTPLARPAAWDFDSAGTSVVLKAGIAAGTSIVLQRITPDDGLFVTFGQGTLLTAEEINEAELFDLYLIQELQDQLRNGLAIPSASAAYWNRSPRRLDVNMGTPGEVAQTIDRLDQLLGNWPAISGDRFVPTADAVAARLDPYVQSGLPAPLLLPQQEQPGKQWFDQDDLVQRYWDEDAGAWVTLANTGPPGSNTDPVPLVLGGGWIGDRNELRNPGFKPFGRAWPNAKGIVVEGWVQRSSDTTVTYTNPAASAPVTIDGIIGASHVTRLQAVIAPGTQPGKHLYLQQLAQAHGAYYGDHLTFSFLVRSTVATRIAAEIISVAAVEGAGPDVTIIGPLLVDLKAAWQRVVLSGVVTDYKSLTPTSRRIGVRIWLDAGTDHALTLPGVGGRATTITLTDAQLERGSIATRCEVRKASIEQILANGSYTTEWVTGYLAGATAGMTFQGGCPLPAGAGYGSASSVITPTITAMPGQNNDSNCTITAYRMVGQHLIATAAAAAPGDARIEHAVLVDWTSSTGLF